VIVCEEGVGAMVVELILRISETVPSKDNEADGSDGSPSVHQLRGTLLLAALLALK
jgi:hypothetical protein